jgi:hypothetical protein
VVTSKSDSSISLKWDASTNAVGYNIYRDGIKVGSTISLTYEDQNLKACNLYTYTLRAYDNEGNESEKSEAVSEAIDLKLTADTTMDSMTFSGGNLDLNGFKLTINGDLMQTGGQLLVSKGKLFVNGNYYIGDTVSEVASVGKLYMVNAEDYVGVSEDFVMYSTQNHTDLLTNGILEIKGNFTQKYAGTKDSEYNFNAAKDGSKHKVILSREDNTIQIVSFDTINGSTISSMFNTLEVNKPIEFYEFVENRIYTVAMMSTMESTVSTSDSTTTSNGASFYKRLIDGYKKDYTYNYSGVNSITGGYSFNSPGMLVKAPGFDLNVILTYN